MNGLWVPGRPHLDSAEVWAVEDLTGTTSAVSVDPWTEPCPP